MNDHEIWKISVLSIFIIGKVCIALILLRALWQIDFIYDELKRQMLEREQK